MKDILPDGLARKRKLDVEVFLTNRCNLACTYCSSRHLLSETAAKKLSFDQLKRFVDLVSGDKRVRSEFTGTVKIQFSGGEPLLEYGLIKKTVDYIRANKLDFKIIIVTNGTLLTESRMDYLLRNDVIVGISLDGSRSITDSNRRFAQKERGSVYKAVMGNLGKDFPNRRHLRRCRAMTTLTSRTIDALPDIVEFFRHKMGLRKLAIELDAYEVWDRDGIGRFRKALRRLVSGLLAALKPGADAKHTEAAFAEFPFLQNKHFPDDAHDPDDSRTLALFCDGCFYPSPDLAVGPSPAGAEYRVGDVHSGIDLKKLEKLVGPMLADISRRCGQLAGPRSPREGYDWGIANNFPKRRINRILESTSRINSVFLEETRYYMRLYRTFNRLRTAPGFGDLTHSPKYRGGRRIRMFRVILRKDPDVAAWRAGIDYFLYSPGGAKELVLDAAVSGAGSGDTIAAMEGLALYAMMKAGYLKKKLGLTVRVGASPMDAARRRFLTEHGVRVEDRSAGSPGRGRSRGS